MKLISLSEIEQIRKILEHAQHPVFFGGAGVSTDSGIPDFRGAEGLYHGEEESNEYLLSRGCLLREPEKFFSFYKKHMLYPNAKPNATHLALAESERRAVKMSLNYMVPCIKIIAADVAPIMNCLLSRKRKAFQSVLSVVALCGRTWCCMGRVSPEKHFSKRKQKLPMQMC